MNLFKKQKALEQNSKCKKENYEKAMDEVTENIINSFFQKSVIFG